MEPPEIECRTMTGPDRFDAFTLLREVRSDEAALGDALALLLDRPDYGFLWLAYEHDTPVGCVSVAFAVATDAGGVIADLRDLYVAPSARRRGVGRAMIDALRTRLALLEVRRVDAALDHTHREARHFFTAIGFAVVPGATARRSIDHAA